MRHIAVASPARSHLAMGTRPLRPARLMAVVGVLLLLSHFTSAAMDGQFAEPFPRGVDTW